MLASTRLGSSASTASRFQARSAKGGGLGKGKDWSASEPTEHEYIAEMPDAREVEHDVLGSCLAEGLSWWRVVQREGGANFLDLFYDPDLRFVAEAMSALSDDGYEITISSTTDVLLTDSRSERLTPDVQTFLAGLQSRGAARKVSELQSAARMLSEKRAARDFITGIDGIRTEAVQGAHPNDTASALRQLSLQGGTTEDVLLMGDVVKALRADSLLSAPWRVSTGIKDLDACLRGGLEPGRTYYIGARPKVGKSMLLLNIVLEALASGAAVLLVSMEMPRHEVWSRLLAAQAYVDQRLIQDYIEGLAGEADFDPEDWARLKEAEEDLEAAPLYVMFSEQIRHGGDSVISAAMSVMAKLAPGTPLVVAADYLQKFVRDHSNARAEVADITGKWKQAALELGICFISPSQIARAGAEEGMPAPHHLKESGSIEQDADAVFMLNRPKLQDEDAPANQMDIWLALNRNGPNVFTSAFYDGAKATVSNAREEWSGTDQREHSDGEDDDRDRRAAPSRSRAEEMAEQVSRTRRDTEGREDREGRRDRRERDENGRRQRRTSQYHDELD